MYVVEALISGFQNNVANFFVQLIKFLFGIITFMFVYMTEVTISISDIMNEFKADEFAYMVGYGENLTGALYFVQEMTITGTKKLKDKLRESHPNVAVRIGKIEKLIDTPVEDTEATKKIQNPVPVSLPKKGSVKKQKSATEKVKILMKYFRQNRLRERNVKKVCEILEKEVSVDEYLKAKKYFLENYK